MTESHDYLTKVRSLLDTAESFAQEGNVSASETYRERAFALMAKYGIEEHMLAAKVHKDEKPIVREIVVKNPYATDKGTMLWRIATALGVQSINDRAKAARHGGMRKGERIQVLIGFESDIERVEILYTSLLLQAFSEAEKSPLPYGSSRTSFKKSFLTGFSVIVGQRLEEAEARARAEYEAERGTSTELVVVDRDQRVKNHYKELYPRTRKNKRSVSDGTGYYRGQAAGERADIGGKHLGGNRVQIGH